MPTSGPSCRRSPGQAGYAALKADREDLDRYVVALGDVTPERFSAWSDQEQIAFLVNAYNALTLVSIIDRYPVDIIMLDFRCLALAALPRRWQQPHS